MAEKSTLSDIKDLIIQTFQDIDEVVFSKSDLSQIFDEISSQVSFPQSVNLKKFIDFVVEIDLLKEIRFTDHLNKGKILYAKKDVEDFLTLASKLKNGAYYSHYTAMYLLQLTLQIPKTFYLNFEHYNKIKSGGITQEAIDKAFSNDQRKSKLSYQYGNNKILIINGLFTKRLGVMEVWDKNIHYSFTDLERTLIDIAVRPAYSGGVFEVLEAFRTVKGKYDPEKLLNYLNALDFIYPYHQVIGFYLERSGADTNIVNLFKVKQEFDFYLTYNIRNKVYDKDWRLYYPKGF